MKVLAITSVGYEAGGAETILVKINFYLSGKGYIIKTLASDLGVDKEHFNDYSFNILFKTKNENGLKRKKKSLNGPVELIFLKV